MRNFLAEVPALQPLRLVVGLELRGRGDVQMYRVELPGPQISKDIASDESSYVNAATFLVDGGLSGAYVTPE